MKWEDIVIEEIVVNLSKRCLSVNRGFLVLTAREDRNRPMKIAYAVAHATKHAPPELGFKGLTWSWLKKKLQGNSGLQSLCGGNTARTEWNQACLSPEYWHASCKEGPVDTWFDGGRTLLQRLFISEALSDKQKHKARIKGPAHRMHLPESAVVELIPDGSDLRSLLQSTSVGDEHMELQTGSQRCTRPKGKVPVTSVDMTRGRGAGSHGSECTPKAEVADDVDFYDDARSAIQELSRLMPDAEEVVLIGYTSKMFAEDLRTLKEPWHMRELKILLRDLDVIDPKMAGEIPRDDGRIDERQSENRRNIRDLKKEKKHIVHSCVQVKYYRGQPCLRGLLVSERGSKTYSSGFLSIYKKRTPIDDPPDFGARESVVFRLSRDDPHRKALLDSFASWFEFMWEEGSRKEDA